MLALLGSSLAYVTECTSKHFVDADLSERSDDGTMVPGTVSLDGVPKGFPAQGNLHSCDQLAAIGAAVQTNLSLPLTLTPSP